MANGPNNAGQEAKVYDYRQDLTPAKVKRGTK